MQHTKVAKEREFSVLIDYTYSLKGYFLIEHIGKGYQIQNIYIFFAFAPDESVILNVLQFSI